MNQAQKHSVFIVDDDPDDRESIRDAFLANKHQQDYVFMKNGEQLIGHFTDTPAKLPSLILLDLNMPGRCFSVQIKKKKQPYAAYDQKDQIMLKIITKIDQQLGHGR